MRGKLPWVLVLVPLFLRHVGGEEIVLRNGRRIDGKILDRGQTQVAVLVQDKIRLVLPVASIAEVREAPAIAPGGQEEGVVSTTHVIVLKSGRELRCSLLEQSRGMVRLALRSKEIFEIPRQDIAEIRPEGGVVELPKARPPRERPEKRTPAEPPAAKPGDEQCRPVLTPPPVPEEQQGQIEYWLRHLQRQRARNRIQAETHLKAMGAIVVGPVSALAHRPEWLIRCAVLRILAHVKHPAAAAPLWHALDDPHPVVRQVAHEGLTKVTGKKILFDPRGSRKRSKRRWERLLRDRGLLPEKAKASGPAS